MADKHENKNNYWKESNFQRHALANVSPFHHSLLKYDNVTFAYSEVRNIPIGGGPVLAGVSRVWGTLCNALPKQGSLCSKKSSEPPQKPTSNAKYHTQSNTDVLPPLERRIHVFLHPDHDARHVHGSGAEGDLHCETEKDHALPAGIFLQGFRKDIANLAQQLMDDDRMKRRCHTLAFARLQGEPGMIYADSYHSDIDYEPLDGQQSKEVHSSPLAVMYRVSWTAFMERVRHMVPQHQPEQQEFPDKEMLDAVQDFFTYTEHEGRQVFGELDRDADGQLTMDDVRVAMRKMKLPADYATKFMKTSHTLWPKKRCGWSEFASVMQEKEPLIIQLFNSLGVSKSGKVSTVQLKDSLRKADLPATEANVTAMIRFLATDTDGCIKYGQFRRFMLLLPTEQLTSNPWSVWLEAATLGELQEKTGDDDLRLTVSKYTSLLSRDLGQQFQQAAKGLLTF